MAKDVSKQVTKGIELLKSGMSVTDVLKVIKISNITFIKHRRRLGTPCRTQKKLVIKNGKGKCTRCGDWKKLIEFKNRESTRSFCKTCRSSGILKRLNSSIEEYFKARWHRTRSNANIKKVPFTIEVKDLLQAYQQQGGKCFYFDIPMSWKQGQGRGLNATQDLLTVDQLIPRKGYIPGNIVLCTWRANVVKSNLSLEELKNLIPSWYKRIERKIKSE